MAALSTFLYTLIICLGYYRPYYHCPNYFSTNVPYEVFLAVYLFLYSVLSVSMYMYIISLCPLTNHREMRYCDPLIDKGKAQCL